MTDTAKLIAQARRTTGWGDLLHLALADALEAAEDALRTVLARAEAAEAKSAAQPYETERELAVALEAAEAERDALRGLLQTDERIEAENQRLREALDVIARGKHYETHEEIARAALAGSGDE